MGFEGGGVFAWRVHGWGGWASVGCGGREMGARGLEPPNLTDVNRLSVGRAEKPQRWKIP